MDANPRQSFMPNDDVSSDVGNMDLSLKSLWSDDWRLDVDLVGGRKKTISDIASWFSYSDGAINNWGATPRLTWSRDLLDHGNKVLVGFDGYADRLNSERYADRARQFEMATAQIDKYTMGVYARDEFAIYAPLLLGLGARHEQARYGANVTTNSYTAVDDHTTHKVNAVDASLTYVFPNKSKVFTRAGTVYRFPFVDEQISYIGYGSDQMYTDLNPEKGQNYEAGADVVLLESLGVGLTLFRLDMRDEIAYDAVTMSNQNLDDTRRQGLESYATWKWRNLMRWNVNYTLTDAKFSAGSNDGNRVPLVPHQKASLGGRFYLPLDLALDGVATYVGEQRLGGDYTNTGDTLDAYTLVDLALRYTPAKLTWLGLEAFAGVDNVFDKQYASVGYMGWVDGSFSGVYYPSPGRTYKAGLSCRF
jgi:iron complex outermembrane receptor protein